MFYDSLFLNDATLFYHENVDHILYEGQVSQIAIVTNPNHS